jgi:hypothetical protein
LTSSQAVPVAKQTATFASPGITLPQDRWTMT